MAAGLTREAVHVELDARTDVVDFPGFADVRDEGRKTSAAGLTQYLSQGGYYSLLFVMTLREGGRFDWGQIDFIRRVLHAAPEFKQGFFNARFGILLNQVPNRIAKHRVQLIQAIHKVFPRCSVYVQDKIQSLTGTENVLEEIEPLREFVMSLPSVFLSKKLREVYPETHQERAEQTQMKIDELLRNSPLEMRG